MLGQAPESRPLQEGSLMSSYLAGLSVKKDYLYYLFFNDEGELITQKFGLPKS